MRKIAGDWLKKVLLLLHERKAATRGQIIAETGLNHASVSLAVRHLLRHGVVLKVGDMASRAGRRREVFSLNPEAAFFIGVDLESSRTRFAAVNLLGDIRYRWEEDLPWGQRLDLRIVFRGIRRLLANLAPEQRARVLAMGICYPGLLDAGGRLTALNLGFSGFPLLAEFEKLAALHGLEDIPVFLEPDKRCSLLAERASGQGRDCRNGLLLLVERGIGVGILVAGQLIEGFTGMAGEIGHMAVEPDAGDLCACGRRGCLEAIASSPNIVRQYREKGGGAATAAEVWERARQGDRAALEVLGRVARALGLALSHAVTLLNPRTVILAGDIAAGEDVLLPPIRAEMQRRLLPALFEALEFRVSGLGSDVRLAGAAALAFRDSLAQPGLLERLCGPGPQAEPAPLLPPRRARRRLARAG